MLLHGKNMNSVWSTEEAGLSGTSGLSSSEHDTPAMSTSAAIKRVRSFFICIVFIYAEVLQQLVTYLWPATAIQHLVAAIGKGGVDTGRNLFGGTCLSIVVYGAVAIQSGADKHQ